MTMNYRNQVRNYGWDCISLYLLSIGLVLSDSITHTFLYFLIREFILCQKKNENLRNVSKKVLIYSQIKISIYVEEVVLLILRVSLATASGCHIFLCLCTK